MASDEVSDIQAKINEALDLLKMENDPVKRRELLIVVRMWIAALEKLVG
jgi:hypothetical protein